MDKLQHANQLLQWREQRQLSAEQLQQASGQFPLQPATGLWLAQANLILLFGTVVLLGAALIFFLAHNWPFMHYFTKFALAASALVLSGGQDPREHSHQDDQRKEDGVRGGESVLKRGRGCQTRSRTCLIFHGVCLQRH